MRKLWFAQIAKALIVFPGASAPWNELWEMLTLLQTHKLSAAQHHSHLRARSNWMKS